MLRFKAIRTSSALLIGILLLTGCGEGGAPAQGPAMWRLETPSGATAVFMGSIHAFDPDIEWRDDRYWKTLSGTTAVALEIDPKAVMYEAAGEPPPQFLLPDGQTLTELIRPETHARLVAFMEKYDLYLPHFDRMQPWSLVESLSYGVLAKAGVKTDWGVDWVVALDAHSRDLPVHSLDTYEQMLQAIEISNQTDPDRFIAANLDAFEDPDNSFATIMVAWQRGNMDVIERWVMGTLTAFPDVYDALLTQRNARWVIKIETWLEDPDASLLIVAGAAHMVGPDSVIQMLRDRGYTVERY